MNMASVVQVPLSNGNMPILDDRPRSDTDTNSSFQALLLKNSMGTKVDSNTKNPEIEDAESMGEIDFETWMQFFHQLTHVSDSQTKNAILRDLPLGEDSNWTQEEIQAFIEDLLTNDSFKMDESVIDELLTLLNSDESDEVIDQSGLNEMLATFLQTVEEKTAPFKDIVMKAVDNLKKIQSTDDMEKHSKELLQLLKQWSHLTQKQGTSSNTILQAIFSDNEVPDEAAIWRELVKTFQKRTKMAQNKQYHSNAKVTQNDVTGWLRQLIPGNQRTQEKGITHHMTGFQSTPMTKVEQYVIHINQGRKSELPNKQLIDQFQKIIHSSRFLTNMNGTNHLSLSIQPDNLGDMMVKLTQVNGELTAKILVSSQAAKEMLETNLHQLRHMFSPHQVVIERTDANLMSQETINEEGEESHPEQEEQEHPDEASDGQTDSRDWNEDFEAYMEDLLWNEKV